MRLHISAVAVFCAVVLLQPGLAPATNITLSKGGLMALDYYYYSSDTARVVGRTPSGTGIEFSIWYPGNHGNDDGLYFVSSKNGGTKKLVGINISPYDAFTLKFTLVSVNGSSTPDTAGPLIVGAIINNSEGGPYAYQPKVIGFNPGDSVFATSQTATTADTISIVGIVANIPSWWWTPETNPWPESGALVKLLIEPVPGAVAIPEPTAMLLVGIGGLAVIGKRRKPGSAGFRPHSGRL